jgi:group I intron endonuclease
MEIYRAQNTLTGAVYIGKTIRDLQHRKHRHFSSVNAGSRTYFHNAIRKYGKDSFEWTVLTSTDSEKKLSVLERFYISAYSKMYNLYNLTAGGEGASGRIYSDETRLKMSAAQKGKKRKPFTEEHRARLAEAGRKMSADRREKLAAVNKSRVYTDELREKLSKNMLGKKHSLETKAKMSFNKKGKPKSEEHRAKLSALPRGTNGRILSAYAKY